jgi:hypothetical protein
VGCFSPIAIFTHPFFLVCSLDFCIQVLLPAAKEYRDAFIGLSSLPATCSATQHQSLVDLCALHARRALLSLISLQPVLSPSVSESEQFRLLPSELLRLSVLNYMASFAPASPSEMCGIEFVAPPAMGGVPADTSLLSSFQCTLHEEPNILNRLFEEAITVLSQVQTVTTSSHQSSSQNEVCVPAAAALLVSFHARSRLPVQAGAVAFYANAAGTQLFRRCLLSQEAECGMPSLDALVVVMRSHLYV